MGFLATVVLVLLSISGVSTHDAYYVRPTDSSILSCPGQPCLTLGQYTQQASKYFTAGSTFVFLAGNHTGVGAINLANVSGITLKSSSSSYILCCDGFTILCYNVNHFTIEGLSFIYSSEFPRMSAMEILNSWNVLISHSMFVGMGNLSQPPTRAVNCTHSNITITGCHFEGNTADFGGAIHISSRSNVTLTDNVFIRNAANISGGAIFAYKYANLSLIDNTFLLNSATYSGGAVNCKECSLSMTVNNSLQNNSAQSAGGGLHMTKGTITTLGIVLVSYNNARFGGGMYAFDSHVVLDGSFVMFRRNSATRGGALHIGKYNSQRKPSFVTSNAENLHFTENVAKESGGAIIVEYGSLNLGTEHSQAHFTNNSGGSDDGGAIFSTNSNVTIMGNSSFTNNYLTLDLSHGGAIKVKQSNFTLGGYSKFTGNKAMLGGAVQATNSYVYLKGFLAVFEDNMADTGGAIHCENSMMIFHTQQVWFSRNIAQEMGGAVAALVIDSMKDEIPVSISGNFTHNIAGECGGGVFVHRVKHISFINISITNSTGSGICLSHSKACFVQRALIVNNTGSFGGGIHSDNSKMSFLNVNVTGNKANFGGGIYSVYGKVDISGETLFKNNTAQRDGGATLALGTDILLNGTIHFTSNSAQNGGAVCLKSSATVSISAQFHLSTSHNHAAEYGGVVHSEDNTVPSQCNYNSFKYTKSDVALLPYCFLHLAQFISKSITVDSYHDLAGKDGHFLYGGLFDRCGVPILNSDKSVTKHELRNIFKLQTETSLASTSSRIIASKPYQLCFCTSKERYNCFRSTGVEIYRGQEFTVQLVALDQMRNLTSTSITAKTSPETWVIREQRIQNISQNCTSTKYQLYSRKAYDELILYPDGPCRDVGYARAVINVTFRSCPAGFMQSGGACVYEERLQKLHNKC